MKKAKVEKKSRKVSAKAKKPAKKEYTIEEFVQQTVEEAFHKQVTACKSLLTCVGGMMANNSVEVSKKTLKKVIDTFAEAVIATSVASVLAMPKHWKRAWLKDVCVLKEEKV